jgi:hypothetical protein
MMAIPEVMTIINNIKIIHEKKNKDYSAQNKPFENFERSAELMSWFNNDRDKAYISLIGTKLARLATLLNSENSPQNEPIEDSFLDFCTYAILWAASYEYMKFQRDIMKKEVV